MMKLLVSFDGQVFLNTVNKIKTDLLRINIFLFGT